MKRTVNTKRTVILAVYMVGITSGFLFLSFGYSKNNKGRRNDVVSCNLVPITVVSNMRTLLTAGQKGRCIDYSALLPHKAISVDHVNRVLGVGTYTDDDLEKTRDAWKVLKSDCRGWANQAIKRQMVCIARTLSQNRDVHKCFKDYTVEIRGREVSSYDDIRNWCKTSLQDSTAQYAFYEIMYGYWERTPGWDSLLEKEYMIQAGNMVYTAESIQAAQNKCRRKGYTVAGCIARNISEVKGELVKNMRKCLKASDHGCVVSKSRKHEDAFPNDGPYSRRGKGEFGVTVTNDVNRDDEDAENASLLVRDFFFCCCCMLLYSMRLTLL